MLLRIPDFYNQFQCIAGKCTDTCCVGWEIDFDEKTLARYRNLASSNALSSGKQAFKNHKQAFLKKMLENIEDGHSKLLPGDRCPFLRQDGLCEMICELGCNGTDKDINGDSVLCDICREHPRFVEVYGDIIEKGVGLCCEEAVRLLLNASGSINLIESEIDDEPDEMPEGAEEARDAIFAERDHIFELLADCSKPLKERLLDVLDYAVETSGIDFEEADISTDEKSTSGSGETATLSDHAVKQTWIEILGEGESYGPAWDKAFEGMVREGWIHPTSCQTTSCRTRFGISNLAPEPSPREQCCGISLFTEEEGARIVAYMIFRYYAKSLFDGDSLTKVQFAIFFWIILQRFGHILGEQGTVSPQINAIKLLSKQTEYSEEIMEILADNFFQNPAFSVEQFRRIIQEL